MSFDKNKFSDNLVGLALGLEIVVQLFYLKFK